MSISFGMDRLSKVSRLVMQLKRFLIQQLRQKVSLLQAGQMTWLQWMISKLHTCPLATPLCMLFLFAMVTNTLPVSSTKTHNWRLLNIIWMAKRLWPRVMCWIWLEPPQWAVITMPKDWSSMMSDKSFMMLIICTLRWRSPLQVMELPKPIPITVMCWWLYLSAMFISMPQTIQRDSAAALTTSTNGMVMKTWNG